MSLQADQPLVSVVISAYNAEKYLAETLDSVLAQTYPSVEIIVVNDGSSDDTADILNRYAAKGVKGIFQANKGQDAALNNGYRNSSGRYIKFMDSDDLINPEMIAIQMQALNGAEDKVAYGEWARFYNDRADLADFSPLDYWKDARPVDFLTARKEGVMLQCAIFLVPRAIVEKAGLWDERLILFNDTEYFTRIVLAAEMVLFTKGARLYYRSGMSKSISAQRSIKFFESTYLATCLFGEKLLKYEDSVRTRNLVSNTFMDQYFLMYPDFPELGKKFKAQADAYGHADVTMQGGRVFLLLKKVMGWKAARRLQKFFYRFGYLRLLKPRKA